MGLIASKESFDNSKVTGVFHQAFDSIVQLEVPVTLVVCVSMSLGIWIGAMPGAIEHFHAAHAVMLWIFVLAPVWVALPCLYGQEPHYVPWAYAIWLTAVAVLASILVFVR